MPIRSCGGATLKRDRAAPRDREKAQLWKRTPFRPRPRQWFRSSRFHL